MTTGGRAEKSGFYSYLTIFGYLYCAPSLSEVPVVLLNQPTLHE